MTAPRPKEILTAFGKRYPNAWRQADIFRQDKGKDLPDWPAWCFLPLAAAHAIAASHGGGNLLEQTQDIGTIGALAAWRVTQGIYRFDADLYSSLIGTPLSGDIPCDVLYQLPEWCVYVETPDLTVHDLKIYGFFAYLEHDINTGRSELRIILDGDQLMPVILHLGRWPLQAAVDKALAEAKRQGVIASMGRKVGLLTELQDAGFAQMLAGAAAPCLNLLLFICSQAGEVGTHDARPENPEPKRTKQGWRLFAAKKTTTWDVGVRIGAELRRAAAGNHGGGEGGASKRPHMRRAHWHGYWAGPRDPEKSDQRRYDLKWLPPTPVNMGSVDPDELPAVIRPVKQVEL